MLIKRKCKICSKEFEISEARLKWGRGETCSRECQYKSTSLLNRKNKLKITCSCNKEFYVYPYQKNRKYCSKKCAKSNNTRLPDNDKNRTDFGYRFCIICNAKFIAYKKTSKYCSKECFYLAHSDRMKGENNPAYSTGSSFMRSSYRGDGWKKIREIIYKRDKYICQICGIKCISKREAIKTGDNYSIIQCHHKKEWNENNKDNSPENLITICLKCHIKIHRLK